MGKCCPIPRLVYSVAGDPGFTFESWTGANASGVGNPNSDEAGFDAAWAGPLDLDGIPTHVNGAPNGAPGVETDVRFAQSEGGQDEHRLTYWVHNDSGDVWELSDTDTRAESVHVYASCDCPASLVHERYQTGGVVGGSGVNAPYNSQGPFTTVPPGALVKLTVLIHDAGPDFSGFNLRANVLGDATLFDPTSYQERPSVDCVEIEWKACDPYVLAEGESFKPITMNCLDCGGAGGGLDTADVQALIDASAATPATVLPIPDNEDDAAIRTGQVGTSLNYSREDHNHQIVRQTHFDWPGVTVISNATILQDIVLDRRSTEEWVEFETRTRVSVDAGSGWPILNYPNVAGYQQPIITVTSTYRNGSTTYQEDDQPTTSTVFKGAAPVGPYMGIEWSHWSSTRRLYGPFRRENDIPSWYIGASVKYVRL